MQIVDELRRMTAVSATQYEIDGRSYWKDDDLARVLGRNVSARLVQVPVNFLPTTAEGAIIHLAGRVQVAGTLDAEGAILTAGDGRTFDGKVTIASDGRLDFTGSQRDELRLSGLCYDLNAAAADVLTDWASALKLGYDISSGDASLPRSQRHAMLLEQARTFRSRTVAGSVQMRRSDVRRGGRAAAARRAFGRPR